jgi:hypothetical protein
MENIPPSAAANLDELLQENKPLEAVAAPAPAAEVVAEPSPMLPETPEASPLEGKMPNAPALTNLGAKLEAAKKGRMTNKQSAITNVRTRKFKELQNVWADKFKNIDPKFRPKAKSYDAFALASITNAGVAKERMNKMLERDRKEAEDKMKGIFPKRGPRAPKELKKETTNAKAAAAAPAPAPVQAPVVKMTGVRKTVKVKRSQPKPALSAVAENNSASRSRSQVTASNLRRQAENAERKMIEDAHKKKAELLQRAMNMEKKEEAERVEREARAAANALMVAASNTAKRLEAQAAENVRAAMNGRSPPAHLVKGLAKVRQMGRNMTAKNFIDFCSLCNKTRKERKNKGTHRRATAKKNNSNSD